MRKFLTVFSLGTLLIRAFCTPNCPRQAALYDSNSPIRKIGSGFDQYKDQGQNEGFMAPVIQLTTSRNYIDLPVSKFRLPIPCESGPGNFGPISGKPISSIDIVITSYEQYSHLVKTKTAFDVSLTDFLVSVGFENIKTTALDEGSVVAFSYRAYQEAEISIDAIPDRSWWSSDFAAMVKQLDTNVTDSSYDQLISTFGTHYVSHVVIGAYIGVHASVKYCDWKEGNSKSGSVFANTLIEDLAFMAQAQATSSHGSTGKNYRYLSNFNVYLRGGDIAKYSQTGVLMDYLNSIPATNNVTVLARNTLFRGLWELLPLRDPRRDLLQRAVTDYSLKNTVKPSNSSRPDCPSSGPCRFPSGHCFGLLLATFAFVFS